ncbi:MAG: class II SORL domain-containing protein [Bacteroidales bacterium]|nr:class II SORL domain-containing protein [Bacteroidales bacterium]
MERRNLLKMIGLLGIAGTVGIFSSCAENVEEKIENKVDEKIKEDKKAGFNRQKFSYKDPENPTKAELKHTPEISIKETDGEFTRVEIMVGSQGVIHPTTAEHWIDYIKLFVNENLVGTVEFEAGMARGFASFIVKSNDLKTLKAEIGCNLHGIWESSLTLNNT